MLVWEQMSPVLEDAVESLSAADRMGVLLRFYRKFFQQKYPGLVMWMVAAAVWLRFGAVASFHGIRSAGRRLPWSRISSYFPSSKEGR